MSRPTITWRERPVIEKVLKMETGYVLGFTDRTFAHFFAEYDVPIDQYEGSKAKRLHAFLETAEPSLAAKVLEGLLDIRHELGDALDPTLFERYRQIVARLRAKDVSIPAVAMPLKVLSLDYVSELDKQTTKRLTDGEFEGAITTARTMLEAVLRELEIELTGAPSDYAGNLPKQYKEVAKRLRIDDERDDLDENFKQVARGLVQVVHGLAPIRNKMSDSHPRERKPAPHHARVVANSAKTVAGFLIESYLFQRERGTLPSLPSNER